jgi:hypothetical protein
MFPPDHPAPPPADTPLRMLQEARFLETAALMAGLAVDLYRAACTLTGRAGDALSDCLSDDTVLDLRLLAPAHDHLAAHWRAQRGGTAPTAEDWQSWLATELRIWAIAQPALLRTLCLALVRSDTPTGNLHLAEIAAALRSRYPLAV